MGFKRVGNKVKDRLHNEVIQLNDRTELKPVNPNDLTTDKKRKAIERLIFHTEMRDVTKEVLVRASVSTQRSHGPKEDASISIVIAESVLMNSVMDSEQEINVIPMDILNEFSRTKVTQGDEIIAMKIRGLCKHDARD